MGSVSCQMGKTQIRKKKKKFLILMMIKACLGSFLFNIKANNVYLPVRPINSIRQATPSTQA